MSPCFDPTSLLQLEMPDDELTCSGVTISKERCGNPINVLNRALITKILARMSARDVVSMSSGLDEAFKKDLDDLAHLCLCLRYHQKGEKCQVPQVKKKFEKAILAWCARERIERRVAAESNTAELVINLPSVPTNNPVSSNARPIRSAAISIQATQLRSNDKTPRTVQGDVLDLGQLFGINAYHASTSNFIEPAVPHQRAVARLRKPGALVLNSTDEKNTNGSVDNDKDIERRMADLFLASNSKHKCTEPLRNAKSATLNTRPISAHSPRIGTKCKLEPESDSEESGTCHDLESLTGSAYRQMCRKMLSAQHVTIAPRSPAQTQVPTLSQPAPSTTIRPANAANTTKTILRRSLPDICTLCMEVITGCDLKGRAEQIWCRAECGYNFHSVCFEEHLEGKLQADVECAHCDEPWLWDQASLKIWERNV